MKKIVMIFFCTIISTGLFADELKEKKSAFSTAFTAGYVFKHDCEFKEVYGHGMINAITADACYYPWKHWGFGAKLSYWRSKGKTSFLKQPTLAQEVPFTFYLRAIKQFRCKLELYGSLGAGFAWIKEKSYLGCQTMYKGLAELEIGLNYPLWRCITITSAFRYLFPPQNQGGDKKDVGGCDLRAGIGFTF